MKYMGDKILMVKLIEFEAKWGDGTGRLSSEIATLVKSAEKIAVEQALIEAILCPACEGHGTVEYQYGEDEFDYLNCGFCDGKRFVSNDDLARFAEQNKSNIDPNDLPF